jgi:glutathione synthase/RimK-type ligase-like ATP-grasp enzyme
MFLDSHRKVIVKPCKGSGSRGIQIIEVPAQLASIRLTDSLFEKYIAGKEVRYLILNDEVVGVYESQYGVAVNAARYLECVAYERAEWSSERTAMSLKIAKVLGLRFAAVDFLVDEAGVFYLLEVNSSPDLKWFHAPTTGPSVDVAALFMNAVLTQ